MTPPRSRSTATKVAGSRGGAKAKVNAVPVDQVPRAPVVLITGPEEVLADRALSSALAAARAADPEVIVERLDASAYESGRLAELSSPSLFGGGTAIVVDGVESANDAFVTEARAYLGAALPDDIALVLRHSGGVRAKAVLDAARAIAAPEAVCAAITRDEEKVDFAAGEFARHGRRVSPQALRALVDAVGSDLRELAAACEQLATDAVSAETGDTEGRIEADLIEEWFGGRVEVTGFRVADATVAGHPEQALALLRHALATGADPVPLVAAMAAKIRGMAKVSGAGRGRSVDLAGPLGMAPWQIDRARRELRGWNEDGLAAAILVLAEADTLIKGGGRDPVFAVERAVLSIAAARGA